MHRTMTAADARGTSDASRRCSAIAFATQSSRRLPMGRAIIIAAGKCAALNILIDDAATALSLHRKWNIKYKRHGRRRLSTSRHAAKREVMATMRNAKFYRPRR